MKADNPIAEMHYRSGMSMDAIADVLTRLAEPGPKVTKAFLEHWKNTPTVTSIRACAEFCRTHSWFDLEQQFRAMIGELPITPENALVPITAEEKYAVGTVLKLLRLNQEVHTLGLGLMPILRGFDQAYRLIESESQQSR